MAMKELEEHVGAALFHRACATAWATALTVGHRSDPEWPRDEADVPHELADLFAADRALGFQLYRAMPCYAVMMYVGWEPRDAAFWHEIRSLIDDPDERLAAPVMYWLWCGPFEQTAEVARAWQSITAFAGERRLRRALAISGPVPWRLKEPLLGQLSERPDWHQSVFTALHNAAYDVFGEVDRSAARIILSKLDLPTEQTTGLAGELG